MAKRTGIMLAYPYDARRLKKWLCEGPVLIQPKLNGHRAIWDVQEGCLRSSQGNVTKSVPHITLGIEQSMLRDLPLDGELYVHDMPFQEITSIVSRDVTLHDKHREIEYHVYDLILTSVGTYMFDRTAILESHLSRHCQDIPASIRLVPTHTVHTQQEMEELLSIYIAQGYEGIIMRNPLGRYEKKRSTNMMKLKPRSSDWYLVCGVQQEYTIQGEPKEAAGSLICRDTEGNYFKVGSGPMLTHTMREELWQYKERAIGKWAHIYYPEKTERGVPFHPIIKELAEEPGE